MGEKATIPTAAKTKPCSPLSRLRAPPLSGPASASPLPCSSARTARRRRRTDRSRRSCRASAGPSRDSSSAQRRSIFTCTRNSRAVCRSCAPRSTASSLRPRAGWSSCLTSSPEAVGPLVEYLYTRRLNVTPWNEFDRKLAYAKVRVLAGKWAFDELEEIALSFATGKMLRFSVPSAVDASRDKMLRKEHEMKHLAYLKEIYQISPSGSMLRIPAEASFKACDLIRELKGTEELETAIAEVPELAVDLLYRAAQEEEDAKKPTSPESAEAAVPRDRPGFVFQVPR